MSITDAPTSQAPEVPSEKGKVNTGGSLKERLAARRRQLEEDRTFEIPVNGYGDLGLWARYRVLPYEELRRIGQVHERDGEIESEMGVAMSTLASAIVEFLERRPDKAYQSLGGSWGPESARDVFGINSLPPDATVEEAMMAIFSGPSGSTNLMLHFRSYDTKLQEAIPELDEAIRGESAARSRRA